MQGGGIGRHQEVEGYPVPAIREEISMKYTLFWKNGKKETVEGKTIVQAFTLAGYGIQDIPNLGFFDKLQDKYFFLDGKWHKKGKPCKKCGEIRQVYQDFCYDCYRKGL